MFWSEHSLITITLSISSFYVIFVLNKIFVFNLIISSIFLFHLFSKNTKTKFTNLFKISRAKWRRGCHRCLVIYEKHKNVLQYKESECDGDSMYMDQSNPAALPMRSLSKSDHRGAHPNTNNNNNGHSRLSSSDQYIMRSNDDMSSCSKHLFPNLFLYFLFLFFIYFFFLNLFDFCC